MVTGRRMTPASRKDLLRALQFVVVGIAVALGIELFMWLIGFTMTPPYAVMLGATLGAVIYAVDRMAHEVRHVRPDDPRAREESGRNPYADLYFLEYRLSWGSVDRDRYEQRVRPLLRQIAAERLRQRHGADLERDPDRCREIVGDELWILMTGAPARAGSRPPSPREVDSAVRAIERL